MECIKKGKKLRWEGTCETCEAKFIAMDEDTEEMYRCNDLRVTSCPECERSQVKFKLTAYTEVVRSKAKEILPKEIYPPKGVSLAEYLKEEAPKEIPPGGLPWITD